MSAMPTSMASSCSTNRGTISCFKSWLEKGWREGSTWVLGSRSFPQSRAGNGFTATHLAGSFLPPL